MKARFPQIHSPPKEDICYATQNRQEAVGILSEEVDLVLVLGSQNSSNSQRLKELAGEKGKRGYLIDSADDIDDAWLAGANSILITAGASAPESVVQECVSYLQEKFSATVEPRVIRTEQVHFALPKELRDSE